MESLACSSAAVQDTWGPVVDASCAGGFDFTLLFEEAILTLLPVGVAGRNQPCGIGIVIILTQR